VPQVASQVVGPHDAQDHDPRDARTVRHLLSMLVLGITQFGIEASPSDYVECLRGIIALFEGSLIKPAISGKRGR